MTLVRGARAALAAAATFVAVACSDSSAPAFTEDLIDPEDVFTERVTLAGGTELAIGGDDEEFLVQWRGHDSDQWSKPETLVKGPGLNADDVILKVAGGTVVVGTAWDLEDDEHGLDDRRDAAVCQKFSCEAVREDVAGDPMLDAEGEFAAVSTDDDSLAFAFWREGADTWEDVVLEGPPDDAEGVYGVPEAVLLDDGRLAMVVGQDDGDGCAFDLWLGEPRQVELEMVASTAPREQLGCDAEQLETNGSSVSFYNRSIDARTTFAPRVGEWVVSSSSLPQQAGR